LSKAEYKTIFHDQRTTTKQVSSYTTNYKQRAFNILSFGKLADNENDICFSAKITIVLVFSILDVVKLEIISWSKLKHGQDTSLQSASSRQTTSE